MSKPAIEADAQSEATLTQTAHEQAPAATGDIQTDAQSVTHNATPNGTSEVGEVRGTGDYAEMIAKMRSDKSFLPLGETEAEHTDTEEQLPEVEQPAGEAAAPTEETEVQTEPAQEVVATQVEDPADHAPQYRIRPENKLDEEVFRMMKASKAAGEPLTVSEALILAERKLGISKPQTQQAQEQPAAQAEAEVDPLEGITLDDIYTRRKELREKKKEALNDLNGEKAAEAEEELDELADLERELRIREKDKDAKETEEYNRGFDQSQQKAAEYYPDFGVEGSEFNKRVKEVDEAWKELGNPLYDHPNKPMLIAQMVANEMGIAPKAKSKSVAKAQEAVANTTSKPVITPKPARVEQALPLASGSARVSTAAPVRIEEAIKGIKTADSYQEQLKALGLRRG